MIVQNKVDIGDKVVCFTPEYGQVVGIVTKQYFPTSCEQQTLIQCEDGSMFHAPTRLFRKVRCLDEV